MNRNVLSLLMVLMVGVVPAVANAAIGLCPNFQGAVPDTFSVEDVSVKRPGDITFSPVPESTVCLAASEVDNLSRFGLRAFQVIFAYFDGNSGQFDMESYFPRGSEIKFTLRKNLPRGWKFGKVSATASTLRAWYGDEDGTDPDIVTIVAGTERTYRLGGPYQEPYCTAGAVYFDYSSSLEVSVSVVNPGPDDWMEAGERVLSASRSYGAGLPEIHLDNENVIFEYIFDFRECGYENEDADSFSEFFTSYETLNRRSFLLTPSLLEFIPDEFFPFFFTVAANSGMTVSAFSVKRTFGEFRNETGAADRSKSDGLLFRVETLNSGWGYETAEPESVARAAEVRPLAKRGKVSLSPSGAKAIKKCRVGRKMRKGHAFKIRGNKVICAPKRRNTN